MLSRRAEDYLEAIINIAERKGVVRVKDIAKALGVKPSSVVSMVRRLNDMGLVEYRKHDGIWLTEHGAEIGKVIVERHTAIRRLLEIMLVPPEIANDDACVMEHELHPKTIEQIKKLVDFVLSAPDYPLWLKHFEIFCKTGKHPCAYDKKCDK
ncbi:MAG: metal-dependent transcriptional regulator [Candidatus Methanospirare jalkutatii]|nr:metal-dependent transcriptional regulator [Candidatus Methanospirare jalkutatii]